MSPKDSEKRGAPRRSIVDSFSLFIVVPSRGLHRLPIHDISESGIGFTIDVDGEDVNARPHNVGDLLDIRIYLNQSLYFPTQVKVARAEKKGSVRRIGAEFTDTKSKSYRGIKSFIEMIDRIADIAQYDSH